jgi:hypothetical protein
MLERAGGVVSGVAGSAVQGGEFAGWDLLRVASHVSWGRGREGGAGKKVEQGGGLSEGKG